MKLINKISRIYVINTLVIFTAGLFLIYWAINLTISDQINTQLTDTIDETASNIKEGKLYQNPPKLEIKEASENDSTFKILKDTAFYFPGEKEYVDYRELTEVRSINGKNYIIIARTSMVEKDDLFWTIFGTLSASFALLLLLLFIVNRKSSKKIFEPFHKNLEALERFSLHENKSLRLERGTIQEFEELNKSLAYLSEKALTEYNSLKEFSENLSHELQTPVAVIKSKLELIMQSAPEDKEIIDYVQASYQNVSRLDRLIRSLVLLVKLENGEMYRTETIHLAVKAEEKVSDMLEFAELKNIRIVKNINSSLIININEGLLDIILQNLFSNAVRHNCVNGEIEVALNNESLTIKNTGPVPKQPVEKYFERFSYDNKSETSLGLGLAITKKICMLYNYDIKYEYIAPHHILKVVFNLQ